MAITVAGTECAHGGTNRQQARRATQEPTMTAALTKAIRQASIAFAFAASFSALSSTAGFAFSAEAQQMCTGDAFRLCSDEIPNIPKITACMVKNRSSLSSGCRAVLDREVSGRSGKIAATTEAN